MKKKLTGQLNDLKNKERKSDKIESFKKIALNNNLIERGLSKSRGYTLATITDKPYEYKGNDYHSF